ncbi:MAG: hypothetical protein KF849_15355 [Rhizobiaceae bacterium]|nr:hypothetical protein [Rhizobiaceae bacterium]
MVELINPAVHDRQDVSRIAQQRLVTATMVLIASDEFIQFAIKPFATSQQALVPIVFRIFRLRVNRGGRRQHPEFLEGTTGRDIEVQATVAQDVVLPADRIERVSGMVQFALGGKILIGSLRHTAQLVDRGRFLIG